MVALTNLLASSDAGGRGKGREISVNAAEGDDKVLSRIHNNPRRYRGRLILILYLSSGTDNSSSSSRLRLRTIELPVVSIALHALVEEKAGVFGS
jgi:hypothetical protein